MTSDDMIAIRPFQRNQAADWKAFLADSNNGTLFHDLDFLAYHPPERFEPHHLMFSEGGKLAALLPAAIVPEPDGRPFLKSPYGGSVGGFALPVGQRALTTIGLVPILQQYATGLGVAGIEMRIGPNIYAHEPNDALSFALAASGFTLSRRWLGHAIPLPKDPGDVLKRINKRRRPHVRRALREGTQVVAIDLDRLPEFYALLVQHRERKFHAQPSHTLSELERIFQLVPNQTKLFVSIRQDQIMAGIVMFEFYCPVAYAMHLWSDDEFDDCRPAESLVAGVAEHYAKQGFCYLDLGPSARDDLGLDEGVARFKRQMGGVGFCRDTWRWER